MHFVGIGGDLVILDAFGVELELKGSHGRKEDYEELKMK